MLVINYLFEEILTTEEQVRHNQNKCSISFLNPVKTLMSENMYVEKLSNFLVLISDISTF